MHLREEFPYWLKARLRRAAGPAGGAGAPSSASGLTWRRGASVSMTGRPSRGNRFSLPMLQPPARKARDSEATQDDEEKRGQLHTCTVEAQRPVRIP
jgi:hypothetical protein